MQGRVALFITLVDVAIKYFTTMDNKVFITQQNGVFEELVADTFVLGIVLQDEQQLLCLYFD